MNRRDAALLAALLLAMGPSPVGESPPTGHAWRDRGDPHRRRHRGHTGTKAPLWKRKEDRRRRAGSR